CMKARRPGRYPFRLPYCGPNLEIVKKGLNPMDIDKLAKLARERVMNAKSLKQLLNIFELTPEQFEEIEADPRYQRILEHFNIEGNTAPTTPARARLRPAACLKDTPNTIGPPMATPTEPLAACIDAGRFLAKNAGIGEKKDETPTAERFVITINLGEDT